MSPNTQLLGSNYKLLETWTKIYHKNFKHFTIVDSLLYFIVQGNAFPIQVEEFFFSSIFKYKNLLQHKANISYWSRRIYYSTRVEFNNKELFFFEKQRAHPSRNY